MAFFKNLFRIKPMHSSSHHHTAELRRCLTASDLTMLGIGAIIGAGIFVLTGIAAATHSGPAIIISYLLASLACAFSALAYAELAASIGGCGSAYGYAFAGIGELVAWIIGWDLLLEYGMDAATISIGWSAYVANALQAFGIPLPKSLLIDPFHGGIVNLPAVLIILALALLLSIGVKESAKFNNFIVFVKLAVIGLFIAIAGRYFDPSKWHPFMPFGVQGVVSGASLIFFAYIGFDAVSTAAEETVKPERDLPIGIIASLVICTVIYVIFSGILTGATYYTDLNNSSPVSTTLLQLGHKYAAEVVALGAIAGLTTAILAMYYGFTRVYLAMSRDGLLPKHFSKIHHKSHSPRRLIWFGALIMSIAAGVLPINQIANIVNIGTLAAFAAVGVSVLVLRYTKPDMKRPFKTPLSPYIPALGVILCVYLMVCLPLITWVTFLSWTAIGLILYFSYGRNNSILAPQNKASE